MGWIIDLLKEIPLSAVLKEKIAAIEDKYAAAETENAILKDDLREAKTEIAELKQQVEELSHTENVNELELKILHRIANLDYSHAVPSVIQINFFPELSLARIKYYI